MSRLHDQNVLVDSEEEFRPGNPSDFGEIKGYHDREHRNLANQMSGRYINNLNMGSHNFLIAIPYPTSNGTKLFCVEEENTPAYLARKELIETRLPEIENKVQENIQKKLKEKTLDLQKLEEDFMNADSPELAMLPSSVLNATPKMALEPSNRSMNKYASLNDSKQEVVLEEDEEDLNVAGREKILTENEKVFTIPDPRVQISKQSQKTNILISQWDISKSKPIQLEEKIFPEAQSVVNAWFSSDGQSIVLYFENQTREEMEEDNLLYRKMEEKMTLKMKLQMTQKTSKRTQDYGFRAKVAILHAETLKILKSVTILHEFLNIRVILQFDLIWKSSHLSFFDDRLQQVRIYKIDLGNLPITAGAERQTSLTRQSQRQYETSVINNPEILEVPDFQVMSSEVNCVFFKDNQPMKAFYIIDALAMNQPAFLTKMPMGSLGLGKKQEGKEEKKEAQKEDNMKGFAFYFCEMLIVDPMEIQRSIKKEEKPLQVLQEEFRKKVEKKKGITLNFHPKHRQNLPEMTRISQFSKILASQDLDFFYLERDGKHRFVVRSDNGKSKELAYQNFHSVVETGSKFLDKIYFRLSDHGQGGTSIWEIQKVDDYFRRVEKAFSPFVGMHKTDMSYVQNFTMTDEKDTQHFFLEVLNTFETHGIQILRTNLNFKYNEDREFDLAAVKASRLIQNSVLQINYPFFAQFKGNNLLTLRDMHKNQIELALDLKDDFFVCFINDKELIKDNENTYQAKDIERREKELKKQAKTIEEFDELDDWFVPEIELERQRPERVSFCFLTTNKSSSEFKIQKLTLEPYINELGPELSLSHTYAKQTEFGDEEDNFIYPGSKAVETQYKMLATLSYSKPQMLKEMVQQVVQAQTMVIPTFKSGKRLDAPALVIQYQDMIVVKCVYENEKYLFSEVKNKVAQVKAILFDSQLDYPYQAGLYISHDKVGSKVHLISFLQGKQQIDDVVAQEQTTKIIMLIMQGQDFIFTLDETMLCKKYAIKGKGRLAERKNIELELLEILTTSQRSQKQLVMLMQPRNNYLFNAYFSTKMQLTVLGRYFQFYENQNDMLLDVKYQELDFKEEQTYYEKGLELIYGPYKLDERVPDYYLNIFEETVQGKKDQDYCQIQSSADSKQSIVMGLVPKFVSFIETNKIGEERILVQSGNQFYIYKANGEKVAEAKQECDSLCWLQEEMPFLDIEILAVSKNLKYFNFVYKFRPSAPEDWKLNRTDLLNSYPIKTFYLDYDPDLVTENYKLVFETNVFMGKEHKEKFLLNLEDLNTKFEKVLLSQADQKQLRERKEEIKQLSEKIKAKEAEKLKKKKKSAERDYKLMTSLGVTIDNYGYTFDLFKDLNLEKKEEKDKQGHKKVYAFLRKVKKDEKYYFKLRCPGNKKMQKGEAVTEIQEAFFDVTPGQPNIAQKIQAMAVGFWESKWRKLVRSKNVQHKKTMKEMIADLKTSNLTKEEREKRTEELKNQEKRDVLYHRKRSYYSSFEEDKYLQEKIIGIEILKDYIVMYLDDERRGNNMYYAKIEDIGLNEEKHHKKPQKAKEEQKQTPDHQDKKDKVERKQNKEEKQKKQKAKEYQVRQIYNKYMRDQGFVAISALNTQNRLMYKVILNEEKGLMPVFLIWDMDTNKEDRMLDLMIKPGEEDETCFIRGINSTYDFAYANNKVFDLQYSFSCSHFPKMNFEPNHLCNRKVSETQCLINEGRDMMLSVLEDRVIIFQGQSLEERVQLNTINQCQKDDKAVSILRRVGIPLNLSRFQDAEGNNIFHYLCRDIKTLRVFLHNFNKHFDMLDDQQLRDENEEIFLQILQNNLENNSPFDLACQNSSQIVDEFLKCLNSLGESFILSRHTIKNQSTFIYLMGLGLESFEEFLEGCTYKMNVMQEVNQRYWKWGIPEFRGIVATTVLTETQLAIKGGKKVDLQNINEKKAHKIHRVSVQVIAFDFVLTADFGKVFMQQLAEAASENVFDFDSIRVPIKLMWKYYYRRLFGYMFILQVLYFLLVIYFCSFQFNSSSYDSDRDEGATNIFGLFIAVFVYCWTLYLLYLAIQQMFSQGKSYIWSSATFWNLTDLAATLVTTTFFFFFDQFSYGTGTDLASLVAFFLWIKMFQYLRIFAPTATFIRMMTEVVRNILVFAVMLVVALLAFSNAFYVLDGSWTDQVPIRAMGGSYGEVMSINFQSGLGEYATDDYDASEARALVWIFFLLCTLFIQILFFNVLIAIISDTFDNVQEIREQAQLKEYCKLMAENWHLVEHHKTFKRTKFIIAYAIEKIEEDSSSKQEGRLTHLKTYLHSLVRRVQVYIRFTQKQHKDELTLMQRNISYQLSNLQHYLFKKQKVQEDCDTQFLKQLKTTKKNLLQKLDEKKKRKG